MWNDSIIEAIRLFKYRELDLMDLGLGRFDMSSFDNRIGAANSVIEAIKRRDPNERIKLVKHIESSTATDLPSDLMMTDEQVRELAGSGVTIGAHTVSHPILSSITEDVARAEILESKSYLESLIQDEIQVFAYPNGRPGLDYGVHHAKMVKEIGFKAALSTHWGVVTPESDSYQLTRFTPWDRERTRFVLRLLAHYRNVDPLIKGGI